jgi:hypothetical protein
MGNPGFQTKREEALAAYEAMGKPFIARAQPYHSVQFLQFDCVSFDAAPSPGVGYMIARAGQELNFFSYGVGDRIQLGTTQVQLNATESETTLTKGKSTQGGADFVIEGLGLSHRGTRMAWSGAMLTHLLTTTTDSGVEGNSATGQGGVFDGTKMIMDPAALITPPQVFSPFNMEDALLQALLPVLRINFEIDGAQSVLAKLGPADIMPQAGASSYLRSNGVPSTDNRFKIPEGILWRRDGETDSELVVKARLDRDIIVPATGVVSPFDGATLLFPDFVVVDLSMRLYGLELRLPSAN